MASGIITPAKASQTPATVVKPSTAKKSRSVILLDHDVFQFEGGGGGLLGQDLLCCSKARRVLGE